MKHNYQVSATLVALFFTLAALLTIATASANESKPSEAATMIEK